MAQQTRARNAGEVAVGDEPNPFSTDAGDELPVCVQLGWRLEALIATGRLPAGERLPSSRRLAGWAGVNVNTVRAVYARLEGKGLVVSRQGQGTFVADGIEPAPELEEIVTGALRRARALGLDPRELAIVATACASMPGALGAGEGEAIEADVPVADRLPDLAEESEAIEVRHELRRQIARLEAELAAYLRDLPSPPRTAPRFAEAHVAGVEELEQTRDTLIAQLSEAQQAALLRAREDGRARALRREVLETEASTDPGAGPLERAMSWWPRKP